MTPEQLVFNKLYDICVELGYSTYEYLPMDEVSYPFVIIGEQFSQNSRVHKDFYNKDTQVTIHIWHNDPYKRKEFTNMMGNIEKSVVREFGIDGESITQQIIGDPDNADLLHGIIETDIRNLRGI